MKADNFISSAFIGPSPMLEVMAEWIRRAMRVVRSERRDEAERLRDAVMREWLLHGGLAL